MAEFMGVKYELFSADWKQLGDSAVKELKTALKPLGINMYVNPTYAGSDALGFILTPSALTKKQVTEIAKHEFPEAYE